jgi:hypothetical protein
MSLSRSAGQSLASWRVIVWRARSRAAESTPGTTAAQLARDVVVVDAELMPRSADPCEHPGEVGEEDHLDAAFAAHGSAQRRIWKACG